jgi:uncharacterized protein YhaN
MRLLELHLKAFGQFTDHILKLGRPGVASGGLCCIIGRNEAGKTTSLNAIERLLFGFKRGDEKYDFMHSKSKMMVGAFIEDDRGQAKLFWRKKTGNALFVSDLKTPVPESILEQYLDGVPVELFMSLFGLNQETLRRGGKDLVLGKGDFSKILFGESLGDLHQFEAVRTSLKDEAERLFKPNAGAKAKTHLNQIKPEKERIETEIQNTTLTTARWIELEKHQKDFSAELERVKSLIGANTEAIQRIHRQERSIEHLKVLRETEMELLALGNLPRVGGSERDRFVKNRQLEKSALEEIQKIRSDMIELALKIEAVQVDEVLVDQKDEVTRLHLQVKEIQSLQEQIASKASQLEIALNDIETELTGFGYGSSDLDALPKLTNLEVKLFETRDNIFKQEEELKKAEMAKGNAEKNLIQAETELELAPMSVGLNAVESAIYHYQAILPELSHLPLLMKSQRELQIERAQKLQKLSGWNGSWEEFALLKMPSFVTVGLDEMLLEKAENELVEAQRVKKEFAKKHALLQAKVRKRVEQERIPAIEVLESARGIRRIYWSAIRGRWLGELLEGVDEIKPLSDLQVADAFETHVKTVDQIADQLRYHAETTEWMRQLMTFESELEVSGADLIKAESNYNAAFTTWQQHYRNIGVEAISRQEMDAWPKLVLDIQEISEKLQRDETQIEATRIKWDHALADSILPLLEGRFQPHLPHTVCFDLLSSLRDSMKATIASRTALEHSIQKARIEVRDLDNKITKYSDLLKNARRIWDEQLIEFGLTAKFSPEKSEIELHKLNQLQADIERYRKKLIEHENDKDKLSKFENDVYRIAAQVGYSDLTADQFRIVQDLAKKLSVELKNKTDLQVDQTAMTKLGKTLDRYEKQCVESKTAIQEVCILIGLTDPEAVELRFGKMHRRDRLEESIQSKYELLATLAENERLETWLQEVASLDSESAMLKVQQFEERNYLLENEQKEWNRKKIETDLEISRINIGLDSGLSLQKNQQRLDFFESTYSQMKHYIRVLLSNRLLEQAAESYRQSMGEQVIEFASRNFKELSLGAYSEVRTVNNEDFGRRLAVVKNDEDADELHLDDLSEGTRDQLFLALKLAMIENRLMERRKAGLEMVPVILDDVLVNFDDDRAAAAFRLFSKLAEKTQVIFLTHHQHLEGVARRALGGSEFGVHRLGEFVNSQEINDSSPSFSLENA